jgi:hypothetical protein
MITNEGSMSSLSAESKNFTEANNQHQSTNIHIKLKQIKKFDATSINTNAQKQLKIITTHQHKHEINT